MPFSNVQEWLSRSHNKSALSKLTIKARLRENVLRPFMARAFNGDGM